ncbi:conserved hypothetical protein [Leishmania major strain Friedlin]|uniref:Conserved oligomeric Golgi complex subunit 2 n=1 Tax=Leishmania major TaxID=5664 RepID=Q4Q0F6_LEIMA|nr:conserved hypothetical protein [Leishmania major strain Friedlin]CAG9584159.1 COG_(conserved_oligomeric_Golgi)_complex_component_-_COG2/Domain_of_unknown_function_(DUF3510)_-_putative [Leishmania major strain Friedlin]CAJ09579.1 conserved hypothetical protein [Leishmania major strain Friedlin]|eukprot:XP_001687192.1 conserved hypothetical protein [Leishmania major strain Friedlin]
MSYSSAAAESPQDYGQPSSDNADHTETASPPASANDLKGPSTQAVLGQSDATPTAPSYDNADNAEADAELLKQQLKLIQLCFAEHEFGIIVDENNPTDSRSISSSSDASSLSSSFDSVNGHDGPQRRRGQRGLPAYDPLSFVKGKVQHGVPLASLSRDLHAYVEYLEDKIAQCVNTDVHTAFVSVSGHLVGMRDELSYMDSPLTTAMEKLSSVVSQLSMTSQKVKGKVKAACDAEMERAFDAMYLKCMVLYETVAYQLDDLAELLHITAISAVATARSAATGTVTSAASAPMFPLAMASRDDSDKSGAAPGKMSLSITSDTRLSDAALDVLEDAVLLFQELKEIHQRLGSLPSRQQEKMEVMTYVAAAEQSVMGVLELVLVHTSQLVFRPPSENSGAASTSSPSAVAGNESAISAHMTTDSPVARQLLGRVIELYAQAGEMRQFAAVFRNAVLRPPLEAVVSWKAATQARQSAEGTVALLKQVKAVLQTTSLPLLPLLREHYGAALHPTATIVWPVLSETLVKKLPSLFEVGIPNHFQVKYKAAYELLAIVESSCADLEELAALRQSPDVVLWNHKWNINVYAALRVSEVDKAVQSVSSPLDRLPAATNSQYHLRLFYIAHQQLLHLFSSTVFSLLCTPWFLRQTVVCCYRVLTRVQEAVAATTPTPSSGVSAEDRRTGTAASENGSTSAAGAHDTLLLAIADAHTLSNFLTGQLRHVILGRLAAESGRELAVMTTATATTATTPASERSTADLVTEVLQFASASVCGQFVQRARATLVHQITDAAVVPLQNIKSVRSAYSHTRKTMPSAASWYVDPALQPLQKFAEEAQRSGFTGAALQDSVADMLRTVVSHFVALARETLLTAKKTEESWEKLRRRKEGASVLQTTEVTPENSEEVSGCAVSTVGGQRVTKETATDRDKMTIQLWMDARAMLEVVQLPPLSLPSVTAAELFEPAFGLLRRAEWIQGADIPEPPDVDA